jgi:hypothetical protein
MCLDDERDDARPIPEAFILRGEELLEKPLAICLGNPEP